MKLSAIDRTIGKPKRLIVHPMGKRQTNGVIRQSSHSVFVSHLAEERTRELPEDDVLQACGR